MQQQICFPAQTVTKCRALRALQYFGIIEHLWPIGLQVLQQA